MTSKHHHQAPESSTLSYTAPSIQDNVDNFSHIDEVSIDNRKIPVILKVFGILCIIVGAAAAGLISWFIVRLVHNAQTGSVSEQMQTMAFVIAIVELVLLALLGVCAVVFGIRLIRNKRRNAARIAIGMIVVTLLAALCEMMSSGFSVSLVPFAIIMVFLVVLQSYLDPSLAQERRLKHHLRDMELRKEAQDGTLGRDESGKGYISLNFFNLFWIFVVCSILGLLIETIFHMIFVDPGHYQDRAGLIFGPFSPIYGFGAVLMTIALNRFHDKNILIIFLVSAVVGGAFEFFTSWFMQFAFGIEAWNYSGTFLSIDGRTNGMFMCMWGVLGVIWIKLLLPGLLKLVNLIPWNWRYAVTTICAALLIADGALTLITLDCWYQREAHLPQDTAIQQFCDQHFGNAYMADRFQSMSLNPESATRAR
ncbi:putative ABC transporter permease [Adlercreutzia agrestimuris]|uniref:putative ABC transporter permease n=1 Tax=Adlercreutzia agrestimuris TaxID=2941324 RepID=UPI00203B6B41|nr:putative ABC transporter permease [Adlercreutzia agrestimuris]